MISPFLGPANFFRQVGRYLGADGLSGFPNSYISIDLETIGCNPGDPWTLPLEVGWAIVDGGEVEQIGEMVLDWTSPELDLDYPELARRMSKTAYEMQRKNNTYRFSCALLEAEGLHPPRALEEFLKTLHGLVADGYWVLGHNAWRFDLPILDACGRDWAGGGLTIPQEAIVDTLAIERMRLRGELPDLGLTRGKFHAKYVMPPGKGGLADCARLYELEGYDAAEAHGAAADAVTTSKLLERMRELAEVT